jgi:hypothetical protein
MVALEELVPFDQLLLRIDVIVSSSFIRDEVYVCIVTTGVSQRWARWCYSKRCSSVTYPASAVRGS